LRYYAHRDNVDIVAFELGKVQFPKFSYID